MLIVVVINMKHSGQFIKNDKRINKAGSAGSFKPGYDPRRKQKAPSLVEECQSRTDKALKVLDYILNAPFSDKTISATVRKQTAEYVLERGHGKIQSAEVLALAEVTPEQVQSMTLSQIAAKIAERAQ